MHRNRREKNDYEQDMTSWKHFNNKSNINNNNNENYMYIKVYANGIAIAVCFRFAPFFSCILNDFYSDRHISWS